MAAIERYQEAESDGDTRLSGTRHSNKDGAGKNGAKEFA